MKTKFQQVFFVNNTNKRLFLLLTFDMMTVRIEQSHIQNQMPT